MGCASFGLEFFIRGSWGLLDSILFQRLPVRWAIVGFSFGASFFGVIAPLFQKLFVDRLMGLSDSVAMGFFDNWATPLLLVGAFVAMILATGGSIWANWLGLRESILLQGQLADSIYAKILGLRSDQLRGRTIGELVAIYATDVPGSTAFLDQTLPMAAGIFFPLIMGPLAVHWIADVPLWATLLLTLFIILLNIILANRQARFFIRFKQLAAERTGLVGEWIQNLRLLRILGWVRAYESKIHRKRVEETANRVAMVTNGQTMGSIGSSISFFINLSGVASVVLIRGGDVRPGELLALLWIFGVFLARPFRQIPWLFTWMLDALTSLRRVEAFLGPTILSADEERGHSGSLHIGVGNKTSASPMSTMTVNTLPSALSIRGLNLSLGGRRLLNEICFDVPEGQLVAVVGEVGAGKSLLLLSLMGETGATFERFYVGSSDVLRLTAEQRRSLFSYVPQEGFVMSATLRENVVLQYESQENGDSFLRDQDERILAALNSAQFNFVQERVEEGLETEIGERGVNLSGGQRQRVSLARADIHRDRPIFLLDDCLSAVDVETERRLISGLLSGEWRKQTRILSTHRLSVLREVDHILFLEEGRIEACGTLDELLRTSEKFRRFAMTVAREESDSDVTFDSQKSELAVTDAIAKVEAVEGAMHAD